MINLAAAFTVYSKELYIYMYRLLDGSRDSVDAEELCEEHDELDSALQEHDSATTRQQVEQIGRDFVTENIMVATIQAQQTEFIDK